MLFLQHVKRTFLKLIKRESLKIVFDNVDTMQPQFLMGFTVENIDYK